MALALKCNPDPDYWTVGYVTTLLVGNHEILKEGLSKDPTKGGNRLAWIWSDEGEAGRQATPMHDGRCSLIELLRT